MSKQDQLDADIQSFWQENPCGENRTGKLDNWAEHFKKYDEFRYSTEGHILDELDQIDFTGKKVLEIGIGQAADSLHIAQRGGIWHGLDVTQAAVMRAQLRFEMNSQSYGEVKQGSATAIPWPDDYFDVIYSHGVLHHIPDIKEVQSEIFRVLKKDGLLVAMMYHKNSLNYWLSICVFRRLGLLILYALHTAGIYKPSPDSVFGQHIKNAQSTGIFNYLRLSRFIHKNTDGPSNPYAKVYTRKMMTLDFPDFHINETKIHFLNTRHFPGVKFLPKKLLRRLDKIAGWHIWFFMRPKK